MIAFIPTHEKVIPEAEYEALGSDYEIIDGELMERQPMSVKAVVARDNLYDLLKFYVKEKGLGYFFGDGLIYYLHKTEKGIKGALIPDLSYIRNESLLPDWTIDQNYPGAPDLAIEVISPSNTAEEMTLKVRRYLEAGTEQVWLVYPEAEEILQYLRDNADKVNVYRQGSVLEPNSFFPGLRIVVADVFQLQRTPTNKNA